MIELTLEPVFFNTELSTTTINYLKNQKYIKYKKINIFIKNNFTKKYPYGFIIVDKKSQIFGFLGTMFSERINGSNKKYIYCNLHTWIVEKKNRLNFFKNSKKILQPIFAYNCMFFAKPVLSLIRMFERNFSMLNLEIKLRIAFLPKLRHYFKKNKFEIITNQSELEENLSPKELLIYLDHKELSCYKFLVIEKKTKKKIFIVAQKKRKKLIFNFLELIYVSDSKSFNNSFQEISSKLFKKFKILFIGENFLEESQCSIPNSEKFFKDLKQQIVVKNMPNYFKFNILYSEFVY